jgi:hypothetical protein
LADIEDECLNQVYPQAKFTVDDWPNLFQDHVDKPVPYITGTAIKLPGRYIDDNAGSGPWLYGLCQAPNGGTDLSVLTVYRNGRIVDSSEYTVKTDTTTAGYNLLYLEFSNEQVDFNNSLYTIEADVKRDVSVNAVDEIKRLLEFAGLTTDSTTFSTASTYYDSNIQTQDDIAFVEKRRIRGIIQDLLVMARSNLYRKADGSIAIEQDIDKAVSKSFDEDAGDPVELQSVEQSGLPQTIALEYRPSLQEPRSELQHELTRTTSGFQGEKRWQIPYLRDHTAADKLVDYLGKRTEYGKTAQMRLFEDTVSLGDVIEVDSSSVYDGTETWKVQSVKQIPNGLDLRLLEHNPEVYNYTSGSLPTDATQGYKPDYSETPPAAPTNLSVDANGTYQSEDGTTLGFLELSADLPDVNAQYIEFLVTNTVNNQQFVQKGEVKSGSTYYHRFQGLEPGVDHDYVAWAVNSDGVKGVLAT